MFEEEIEYSNNNKIDDYDETIYEEVLYKNISSLVSPQSAKKIAKTEKK